MAHLDFEWTIHADTIGLALLIIGVLVRREVRLVIVETRVRALWVKAFGGKDPNGSL